MNEQNKDPHQLSDSGLLSHQQQVALYGSQFAEFNKVLNKIDDFKREMINEFDNTMLALKQKYQASYRNKIRKNEERNRQLIAQKDQQIHKFQNYFKAFQQFQKSFQPSSFLPPKIHSSNVDENNKINEEKVNVISRIAEPRNVLTSYLQDQNLNNQFRNKIQNSLLDRKGQRKHYLVAGKNYTLLQVSMKLKNTTIQYLRLQYVRCVCQKSQYIDFNKFTQNDIRAFNLYHYDHIASLQLRQKQLEDNIFCKLTMMNWKHLISLSLQDNLLKDIVPLQNLNLEEFVELDVSWNPLNQKSAEFLGKFPFKKLIYFSVSFQNNNKSWQILLQNGMNNFSRLQAIDIYDSNKISPQIIINIKQTLRIRSMLISFQMKSLKSQQNFKQPIIITWCESKQLWNKLYGSQKDASELQQRNQQWKTRCCYVPKIPEKIYLEAKRRNNKRGKKHRINRMSQTRISHKRNHRIHKQQKTAKRRIIRPKRQHQPMQSPQKLQLSHIIKKQPLTAIRIPESNATKVDFKQKKLQQFYPNHHNQTNQK